MRCCTFFVLLLCVLSTHQIEAVTVDDVELQDESLYDSDNHYYGGDLTVVNHSPHPMYASVSVIKQENVIVGINTGVVPLDPNQQQYLGRIQQSDPSKDWSYQTELSVRPDCDLPRENNSPKCSAQY
jgi:hypothetical protein